LNILITCAGRRGYLVEYFREVVGPLGGRVITANSEYYAAGLLAGDRRYMVPPIGDPSYIPRLLEIAECEEVGLVLSLFDIDLPLLAAARDRFRKIGAEVAISDSEVIEIANDKWRMFCFLNEHGIATPRTWLDPAEALAAVSRGEVRFPLFVKPRWGMGSMGVFKANDHKALQDAHEQALREVERTYLAMMAPEELTRSILIQEFVSGIEYGADILNDFSGAHLATAIKRKISSRPDGADFAVTVDAPEIETLCAELARLLRHHGNLDIDVIQPDEGPPQLLEINARFGGGYPFSHLAGARFPRALVQMVRGEKPDPGKIETGVHAMLDIMPRQFDTTNHLEDASTLRGKSKRKPS